MTTSSPLSPPPSIAVLSPDSPGASLAPMSSGIAVPVTHDPVPVLLRHLLLLASDSSMTVTSDPALVAPSETIVAPEVPPLETLASALFDRIQDLRSSHSSDAAAHDAVGQQLLGSMLIADRVSTPGWLKWGMELLSEGRKEALMQELAMVNSEPEEALRSAQHQGHQLVRHSPTPFEADIVEEIVDGPPTSPESIPADDKMVDADEPQVDELEGEDEVDPPSPKQVKPAPSTAKTPSSKTLVDTHLRNITVDAIDSQGVIHLKNGVLISQNQVLQSRPSYRDRSLSPDFFPRWRTPQSCCLDLKGWLPLRDFYELRGWPSPDEPSPEELHESHAAFRDYDEQIRALNKHGVGVKGAMEEQKAFREGRHVPRRIVPMHGKPPILDELPAHGQLSFLVADVVVALTVSSSTAGPSTSTSIAFALPELEEVKPSTTKAGRGVKRSGSMEASSSGVSIKKEVKEEVKEEVKSEPVDVKPASSSRSAPARRATATPSGEVPFISVPLAPYPTHASSVT
ncbi:uncharacterized protein LAESUDRAFT_754941 [Laetiporus sulphureus 93-53]|uniref:Uncharacterized protein n=1 Tax=Laetiporus sulphureus 93-53 TaxID=1314785 RepID=A0A165H5R3_9APHY|nr:uncharacterized protein LAESUDRAFT_754941 [Laetiporus sulphureus 93-53]KZT11279.1 hypothetical protein LAESUDRAFT_754941 [Laetiporus sulphureus 93-53]